MTEQDRKFKGASVINGHVSTNTGKNMLKSFSKGDPSFFILTMLYLWPWVVKYENIDVLRDQKQIWRVNLNYFLSTDLKNLNEVNILPPVFFFLTRASIIDNDIDNAGGKRNSWYL